MNSTLESGKREKLLREIIEAIRNSLEINEVIDVICDNVAEVFDADRATITEFIDQADYSKHIVYREYKSHKDIKGVKNLPEISAVAAFWGKKLLDEGAILAIDNVLESNIPSFLKHSYSDLGVKSIIGLPIKKDNEKWGMLVISKVNDYKHWTSEDIDFLKAISNQIFIAIHQAKLYEKQKQTAQKESLLRTITESIRSSLNINDILHNAIYESAKLLGAMRVYYTKYDELKGVFLTPDKNFEYLANSEVKSYKELGETFESYKFFSNYAKAEKNPLFIFDLEEYIRNQGIESTLEGKNVKKFGGKSSMLFPLALEDKVFGGIVFDFDKPYVFTSEDIEFAKIIVNQSLVAIQQANLYEKEKKTAEREKLLRKIVETIRSSLDIQEAKEIIIKEIGKTFNADRCYFRSFDKKNEKFLPPDVEYLYSKKLPSLINSDINQSGLKFFFKEAEKQRGYSPLIINQELLEMKNLQESELKSYFDQVNIKTDIAIPMWDKEDELSFLVLHYKDNLSFIPEEEISLMETLAKQVIIAINQSKLYEETKKQAQINEFSTKIVSLVKSNLNFEEVLSVISNEVLKFYKLQAIQIIKFADNDEFLILGGAENSKNGFVQNNKIVRKIIDAGLSENNITSQEVEFKINNNISIKQLIMVPLKIDDTVFGYIALYCSTPISLDSQDNLLLGKISDNVSIAVRNSDLYTQSQFVSNVAHELRTPLTVISGYAENLLSKESFEEEKTRKQLNKIYDYSLRMENIISNLMILSSLSKDNIDFEEVNTCSMLSEMVKACSSKAKQKNIKISLNCKSCLQTTSNKYLFEQIILNLLKNAIEYSSANTEIIINSFIENHKLIISVEDSGCGIKEEDFDNIFKRFYRAEKSRSRQSGGAGLGLSIVKEIVNLLDADIKVESEIGKGSIFTVSLPVNSSKVVEIT